MGKISGAGSASEEIFWNVSKGLRGLCAPSTLTLFATRPLGHCVTCKGSSYTKNEYNFFYQKLDAEYFFIQQFFRKKQYFLKNPWKTALGDNFLGKGGLLRQKLT